MRATSEAVGEGAGIAVAATEGWELTARQDRCPLTSPDCWTIPCSNFFFYCVKHVEFV